MLTKVVKGNSPKQSHLPVRPIMPTFQPPGIDIETSSTTGNEPSFELKILVNLINSKRFWFTYSYRDTTFSRTISPTCFFSSGSRALFAGGSFSVGLDSIKV